MIEEIATEVRNCENCGSSDVEFLWQQSLEKKSKNHNWRFNARNVICRSCGFVYLSPRYTEDSLQKYYGDCGEYSRIDYNIKARIEVLRKQARPQGTYLELGAKQKTAFHDGLADLFGTILTQDIGTAEACDVADTTKIEAGTVDVLSHYYVLEHVPAVRRFLETCHALLKPNGIMVVEVPDIALYPKDISGMVFIEHTNHFSIGTLDQIARQAGFELIEQPQHPSRPFGFVAVFKRLDVGYQRDPDFSEYETNRTRYRQGLDLESAFSHLLRDTRRTIADKIGKGRKVVVWGANGNFDRLFPNGDAPEDLCIVDSDPSKADYVKGRTVRVPDAARDDLVEADHIVICTHPWRDEILETLRRRYGKTFRTADINVVDPQALAKRN